MILPAFFPMLWKLPSAMKLRQTVDFSVESKLQEIPFSSSEPLID
jgi:hypothetical protein